MSLTISNLNKHFGDNYLIKNFNFCFPSTGLFIIRGASGIGKTTLLRIIAGIDKEYSGDITGGGIKNVSFMFQEYRLFPSITSLENALIGTDNRQESARDAVELLEKLKFNPSDFGKKINQLSGGMKQRISFVRSLLKKSPVLLLDEPTKELNSEIVDEMLDIIEKEAERRLVLLVSHEDLSKKIKNCTFIDL